MTNQEILRTLLEKLLSANFPGGEGLGEIIGSLERLFESLTERSSSLGHSYYEFFKTAEVIWVSCLEAKRPMGENEMRVIKRLLKKLEVDVGRELEATQND